MDWKVYLIIGMTAAIAILGYLLWQAIQDRNQFEEDLDLQLLVGAIYVKLFGYLSDNQIDEGMALVIKDQEEDERLSNSNFQGLAF